MSTVKLRKYSIPTKCVDTNRTSDSIYSTGLTLASSGVILCTVKRPFTSYIKRKFSPVFSIAITSSGGNSQILLTANKIQQSIYGAQMLKFLSCSHYSHSDIKPSIVSSQHHTNCYLQKNLSKTK